MNKLFIENTLHEKIDFMPYKETENFPLILLARYDYFLAKIQERPCLFIMPKEKVNLSQLRKDQQRIQILSNFYCILYLTYLNTYAREKMILENIPFILEGKQIYLPSLGLSLKPNETRSLNSYTQISFLTQKFLLSAIYESWNELGVSESAMKMNVSKMSMSRVFDEIEALEIPVLDTTKKARKFVQAESKQETWKKIKAFMRSPLLKEYRVETDSFSFLLKSGLSALAALSLLQDDEIPTYAIGKYEIKEKGIQQQKQVPKDEKPGCIIQELGYCIPWKLKQSIDPLTIYLLLKENEDPRVQLSIEEMLENYVWLKG